MKRLIPILILGFAIYACRNDQSRQVLSALADEIQDTNDTSSYPLFIDGGTKIVYQFGHLTADKGLKLYYDTIPNPVGGLRMDDSVRKRLAAGNFDSSRENDVSK